MRHRSSARSSLRLAATSAPAVAFAFALLTACTRQSPDPSPHNAADVATPRIEASERPAGSAAPTGGASDAGGGGAASASASALSAGSDAGSATDAGATAPTADEPPRVKLVTVGMHVGGGPYDEITKEPMKKSVEPRFRDLARCWKHVTKPEQIDAGVDLVIEASGGRAKVSNPRSTAVGADFVPCVVAFFESVDFLKPNNGKTVVSYSVRFVPQRP